MSNWVDIPGIPYADRVPKSATGFEALRWVKQHCPSYITNDAVQKQGQYYYRFYFQSTPAGDRDRTIFALRWG
jgi:hypothetical protein